MSSKVNNILYCISGILANVSGVLVHVGCCAHISIFIYMYMCVFEPNPHIVNYHDVDMLIKLVTSLLPHKMHNKLRIINKLNQYNYIVRAKSFECKSQCSY